jgi:hypothetical protein
MATAAGPVRRTGVLLPAMERIMNAGLVSAGPSGEPAFFYWPWSG